MSDSTVSVLGLIEFLFPCSWDHLWTLNMNKLRYFRLRYFLPPSHSMSGRRKKLLTACSLRSLVFSNRKVRSQRHLRPSSPDALKPLWTAPGGLASHIQGFKTPHIPAQLFLTLSYPSTHWQHWLSAGLCAVPERRPPSPHLPAASVHPAKPQQGPSPGQT